MYRQVQRHGLQRRYFADADFRTAVKTIPALALLPIEDAVDAFEEIQQNGDLDLLTNYFEDNFIGRLRRNRRAQPLFPLNVWNISDRIGEGLPRTNNSVEGWHKAFNSSLKADHPSPFIHQNSSIIQCKSFLFYLLCEQVFFIMTPIK